MVKLAFYFKKYITSFNIRINLIMFTNKNKYNIFLYINE